MRSALPEVSGVFVLDAARMTRRFSHSPREERVSAAVWYRLATRVWVPFGFVLWIAACAEPVGPNGSGVPDRSGDLLASGGVIVRMTGTGEIGDGHPQGDSIWLQAFDLDAGAQLGAPFGHIDYTDYSVIKPDGNPARLRAGPDEPGTSILGFVQISAACVEISGIGRVVNTDELVEFVVRACDNGTPGVGLDFFSLDVHERLVTHGSFYGRGDMLSVGELTGSTAM